MEAMLVLFALALVITLVLGSILGIVAFSKLGDLQLRLKKAEQRLAELQPSAQPATHHKAHVSTADRVKVDLTASPVDQPEVTRLPPQLSISDAETISLPVDGLATPPSLATTPNRNEATTQVDTRKVGNAAPTLRQQPQMQSQWVEKIREQWMIWLGGLMVALAGIFLVKYSVDQGYLGPKARVAMAVLVGIALHASAEWLRRKRGGHDALAALAGGGSITLFGALLAALNLYQLIPPGTAFIGLVLVALATAALALVQGPILAAMGLVGAYLVPILVNTGSNNIAMALLYVTAVNVGALVLMRYVYRHWLWLGICGFTLFWWFAGFSRLYSDPPTLALHLSLYSLIFAYGLFAAPRFDWLLQQVGDCKSVFPLQTTWLQVKAGEFWARNTLALLVLLILQGVILASLTIANYGYLVCLMLPLFILYVARSKPYLSPLAWLALITVVVAILLGHAIPGSETGWLALDLAEQKKLGLLLLAVAVVFSGSAAWNLGLRRDRGLWSSLAVMAPLLVLIPAYFLLPVVTNDISWALAAAALAGIYLLIAWQQNKAAFGQVETLSLTIAAHAGYSLAALFVFQQATLTLVFAAQVLSLAYLRKKFQAPLLEWIIKALVAFIIIRLSLNPFIPTYPTLDQWFILTYGLCALLCYLAARIDQPNHDFRLWLEAAALHLSTLFLLLEIRYGLNKGDLLAASFSLTESGLYTLTFGVLAVVYRIRAKVAGTLALIYQWASNFLLALAAFTYCFVCVLLLNPLLSEANITGPLLFNPMVLAFGLPTAVLLIASYFNRGKNLMLSLIAIASALLFVSLEIRYFFTDLMNIRYPFDSTEVYCYSLFSMLIAIAVMVIGLKRQILYWYQIGLYVLFIVIAKLFIVDMNGLTGLLRVASFMGMGLSLLALAYGHRWLTATKDITGDAQE